MKLSILFFLILISYGSATNGCFEHIPDGPNEDHLRRVVIYTQGPPNTWQPLLVSSAETVFLLTHIVILSRQVSFYLNGHTRPEIRRMSESLSATVAQLVSEIWSTINKATDNMAEVQQWMKLIPSKIQGSLRVVRKVPLEEISDMLPTYLNQIEEAGIKAAMLTNNAFKAFEKVLLKTKDFDKALEKVLAQSRIILENLLDKEENSNAQINLDEIIEVLTKISQSLHVLVSNWRKQLEFFTTVESHAVIMKSMSSNYGDIGKTLMKKVISFDKGRYFLMDSLIKQARKVQERSYLVYTMAKIYVGVSRNYLLEPLSKVNRMFKAGMIALRNEVAGKMEETKTAITELIEQEDQAFRKETGLQKQRYDKLLENCGGLPQAFTQTKKETDPKPKLTSLFDQLDQLADKKSDPAEDFD